MPERTPDEDCHALRHALAEAKKRRNDALVANAQADDSGDPLPHTAADLEAMRLAVDVAALEARTAGCEVDDIVGPNVGRL